MNNLEIIELGTLEIKNGIIRVSDPCYDKTVWCCGTVENCKTGPWEAAVMTRDCGEWGIRNAALAIRYADNSSPKFSEMRRRFVSSHIMKSGTWSRPDFEVGVDSGQAGFFDDAHYQDAAVFEDLPLPKFDVDDIWYGHVCDITLSQLGAGVLPFGAVSSSGYGDGGYEAEKHTNDAGEVDFIMIRFI